VSTSLAVLITALVAFGYLVAPVALVGGWIRWIKAPRLWTTWSLLSFVGFSTASLSAILAFFTFLYAHFYPFPFYDPLLMKIYGLGAVLALLGIVLGIGGIRRQSILRWHALAAALGMFAFWLIAINGE
jgi:hypothetical protein